MNPKEVGRVEQNRFLHMIGRKFKYIYFKHYKQKILSQNKVYKTQTKKVQQEFSIQG